MKTLQLVVERMDTEGVPSACSGSSGISNISSNGTNGTCSSSSSTDTIVMEPANIYAKIAEVISADAASSPLSSSALVGTSKTNVLSIERMSPASVDSGFDSASFPSSPDCSQDSPILVACSRSRSGSSGGANGGAGLQDVGTRSCYRKNSSLKRRRSTTAVPADIGTALQHDDIAVVPQCSSSLYQLSSLCLSPPSLPISRTSSRLDTFTISAGSLISTDAGKPAEDFCVVDASCPREKTPLSSSTLSSSLLLPTINIIKSSQNLELLSSSPSSSGNVTEQLTEECSTLPSSSSSSSFSSLSSATIKLKELKEPPDPRRIRCQWKCCKERFACDNDLYDHVVKAHLEPLRPLSTSVYSNGGNNGGGGGGGGGGGCSQSSSPTKGRLKNLLCQWGSCKMGLSRGDIQKQFIWLEEHFTTRHAGKAQPYMCLIEGCALRFTLKRSLEEHLRTGHEKAKAKRSHTEEGELLRAKSCYQWTPLPYYIPSDKNDFLDRATEEWIIMRLRQYERTSGAGFVSREPATPRGGAAYRKRRRILTFAIEPLKITPKIISDTMELPDAKTLLKSAFISGSSSSSSSSSTSTESCIKPVETTSPNV